MLVLLFLAFQPASAFNPSSPGSSTVKRFQRPRSTPGIQVPASAFNPSSSHFASSHRVPVRSARLSYNLGGRARAPVSVDDSGTDVLRGMDTWYTCSEKEIVDEEDLEVIGTIPSWLSGKLVRNGPGMFKYGETEVKHQFDGLSKIQKFSIRDKQVSLRARFLRTKLYNETMKRRSFPPVVMMVPRTPPLNLNERVEAFMNRDLCDVGNIFVWRTGEHTYATCDGVFETEFDPDTLETLGRMQHKNNNEDVFSGAHKQPAFAQEGCGSTFGWQGALSERWWLVPDDKRITLNLYRDLPDLTRQFIGKAFTDEIPVMHSFGVTKNFILLVVPSLTIDMGDLVDSTFRDGNLSGLSFLKWSGNKKSMIHVFDAHSMDPQKAPIRSFETEPMYMNHHINAYEDEETGEITMDLIGYTDGSFILNPQGFGNTDVMKHGPTRRNISASQTPGRIRRYKLDMNIAGSGPYVAGYKNLTAHDRNTGWEYNIEMPRFNERFLRGSPYRFVYGMSSHEQHDDDQLPNIVKVDLQNGRESREWYEPNQLPSEPIFVPRPGAADEDDGVLLSVVLDGLREQSYLLVLDAKTMTVLARAYSPITMPYDVHGQFFPDEFMYPSQPQEKTADRTDSILKTPFYIKARSAARRFSRRVNKKNMRVRRSIR